LLTSPALNVRDLSGYPVLYPPKDSIIAPTVERFLISQGIGALHDRIETVSDAFGKEYIRQTDAIWIISRGVVARELSDGIFSELPLDTRETLGPVGLTTRADTTPSPALQLLMNAVRDVALAIKSADPNTHINKNI
jgi:LysR family pca operon transcriptional activator